MTRLRLYALCLVVLVLLAACSGTEEKYGHLTFVIDADPTVRAATTTLHLQHPSGQLSLAADPQAWPLSHTFYAHAGERGRVVLEARNGEERLLSRAIDVTFPTDRRTVLVYLPDACVHTYCTAAETCNDCGDCVSIALEAKMLRYVSSEDREALAQAATLQCQWPSDMDGGVDAGSDGGADASEMSIADAGPDAALDGDASAGASIAMAVAPVVATGGCIAVDVSRQRASKTASAELAATIGGFFADASCKTGATQVTWPNAATHATVYYRAPKPLASGLVATADLSATLDGETAHAYVEVRTRAVGLSRATTSGCVLLDTGQVECFGASDGFALLGFAGGADSQPVPVLTPVAVEPDAQMISGDYSICFLHAGGLRCFGTPDALGAGSSPEDWPAQVTGLDSEVVQADAGYVNGCAVRGAVDKKLWCWGRNGLNECSATSGVVYTPVVSTRLDDAQVTSAANQVEECTAGGNVYCARLHDGSVHCWGGNYEGVEKMIASGAVAIGAGGAGACAVVRVANDDQVWCWSVTADPVQITGLPTGVVQSLALGVEDPRDFGAACVIKAGAVYCWGNDVYQALGAGADVASRTQAVRVALPPGKVEAVAVGFSEGPTMSAIVDGLVYSWGSARFCASGLDPRYYVVPEPAAVPKFAGLDIVDMEIGSDTTCIRLGDGTARCLGSMPGNGEYWPALGRYSDALLTPVGMPGGITQLRFGIQTVYALSSSGGDSRLYDWGHNYDAELATSPGWYTSPVEASALNALAAQPVRLSSGVVGSSEQLTACTLMDDASVYCWGTWDDGSGGTTQIATPVQVAAPGSGITDVAASCALHSGVVECWKDATWTRSAITDMPANVDAFDASRGVVCALKGSDAYCAFEGGSASLTFSDASYVGAGDNFACALLTNGKVQCAGDNSVRQLGRVTAAWPAAAGDVVGLSQVTKLAVGDEQSCALDAGTWKCWGNNIAGQLGLVPYVHGTPQLLPAWGGAP